MTVWSNTSGDSLQEPVSVQMIHTHAEESPSSYTGRVAQDFPRHSPRDSVRPEGSRPTRRPDRRCRLLKAHTQTWRAQKDKPPPPSSPPWHHPPANTSTKSISSAFHWDLRTSIRVLSSFEKWTRTARWTSGSLWAHFHVSFVTTSTRVSFEPGILYVNNNACSIIMVLYVDRCLCHRVTVCHSLDPFF